MKFGEIRKPLLIFCLSASVALHIGAIWLLYAHPYSIEANKSLAYLKPAPTPLSAPQEDKELLVEKIEKALEESLNTATLASVQKGTFSDIVTRPDLHNEEMESSGTKEKEPFFANKPKLREEELVILQNAPKEFAASMPPPFDPEFEISLKDFALDEEWEEETFSIETEKYASVDFTDFSLLEERAPTAQTLEDDYTMTDQQFFPSALPTHSTSGLDPHFIASLKKLKISKSESAEEISEEKLFSELSESTIPKLILPNSVDYLCSQWIKRSLADRTLPNWEHYGLEEITTQLEWEQEIDVDIAIMDAMEDNKYVFSLTLHPEFTTDCLPMKQNFYFLIDRSSSIEKHKFNRFKKAAQRSLAALHEGDHFNIYIFDKNVIKLSERNLPVTPKTIQKAEEFLENQNAKTHFASVEMFTTLDKMLPQQFDPDQLHSVILITDGNTLLNSQKQKSALESWAKKYEGVVNFYTAAAGKANNLVLLDLLSYCTGGKMLYSDTNAGFPRKLVRLVKDLHNPIVKNVSIEISPNASSARIALYPKAKYLPPLFAGQPYTIIGTIDEICNLTLYVQGRNHDRWLNIRKTLSLNSAAQGGRSLEKNWAFTQAKICYDHFLKNGKNTHLKEAVQIVAPYRAAIAEEQ